MAEADTIQANEEAQRKGVNGPHYFVTIIVAMPSRATLMCLP